MFKFSNSKKRIFYVLVLDPNFKFERTRPHPLTLDSRQRVHTGEAGSSRVDAVIRLEAGIES